MKFRSEPVHLRSLYFIVHNVALPRNRELLNHLKDNMKMYRSINCQVTVVLNMDKEASERLKREENYSFSVLSAIETAVELPAAVHDLSSNGDRIVLIQGDSILLNNAPENEEERFHIKRMVTSLLK